MSLSCTVEPLPQGSLVCIRGHADTMAATEIDRIFLQVTAGRPALVVLDLSQMSFVSSLVMGSLVSLHKAVTRHGGQLRVAAVQPQIAEAFARVRLQDILDIHESVTSAIALPTT